MKILKKMLALFTVLTLVLSASFITCLAAPLKSPVDTSGAGTSQTKPSQETAATPSNVVVVKPVLVSGWLAAQSTITGPEAARFYLSAIGFNVKSTSERDLLEAASNLGLFKDVKGNVTGLLTNADYMQITLNMINSYPITYKNGTPESGSLTLLQEWSAWLSQNAQQDDGNEENTDGVINRTIIPNHLEGISIPQIDLSTVDLSKLNVLTIDPPPADLNPAGTTNGNLIVGGKPNNGTVDPDADTPEDEGELDFYVPLGKVLENYGSIPTTYSYDPETGELRIGFLNNNGIDWDEIFSINNVQGVPSRSDLLVPGGLLDLFGGRFLVDTMYEKLRPEDTIILSIEEEMGGGEEFSSNDGSYLGGGEIYNANDQKPSPGRGGSHVATDLFTRDDR